jgi:predicted signal transduction protein with EAL and GGDEF domain
VEHIEQVEALQAMTCNIAQGFYFAIPLTTDETAERLRAQFFPTLGYDIGPKTFDHGDWRAELTA